MCGLTLKKLVAASVVLAGLVTASGAAAQSAGVAPTVIPLSGKLLAADGQPRTGTVVLAVSMYDAQGDPTPRFVESQTITLDATGAYSVQFGATFPDGLPQYLFTNAPGTRWVGVGVSGEPDPAPAQRIMLVSVPYAAKAVSAETLDGKPVGDFVLTSTFRDDVRTVLQDEGVRTSSSVGATRDPEFSAERRWRRRHPRFDGVRVGRPRRGWHLRPCENISYFPVRLRLSDAS
jgi:hypothetical protein